jgi:hypothetical protein
MENEPMLLKCLAGRMDNLMTTPDEKRYIIQKIRDNDLSDIRDALVSESGRPESLRKALMGPLPTREQIDIWLAEWGDRYLPFLNPDVVARMNREQEPSRQLMGCAAGWVLTLLFFAGTGTLAYLWGWWVPLVPAALIALFARGMIEAARSKELKGEMKRRAMWSFTNPLTNCILAFLGALVGLGVRFLVSIAR